MAKKLKWNLILMSVLYLGLGIFLLMRPSTALNVVCYALGGVVLVCAAVQLVRYFAVERGIFQSQLTLISGIICLGLGAFLILRSDIVVRILPIVFGLFVIFDSLGRIQNALDLRRCEYPSWKGFLLLPVLSVVLGVVMILNPFGTMETPVLFNCLGHEKAETDSIPQLLVKQVQSSVYMEDTLRRLGELGVDHILEVGPGSALSGFVKKTLPGVVCTAVETPEQLDAVLTAWKDAE